MELKIIKGINNVGREMLEVSTSHAKIVITFGEDRGTGEIARSVNPMIDGLTTGKPSYDGIFIIRNPENSNLMEYALDEIPVYLERKVRITYDICVDFMNLKRKSTIVEMDNASTVKIKDLEITTFIVDGSNYNTSMLLVKSEGKTILFTGDFRNYDIAIEREKLDLYLNMINQVDYVFVEGKYFGKFGIDYSSGKEIFNKLKNIMKFYKQVFIIQSETDLITSYNMYLAAQKTKKIFIESTFLCNITSLAVGSAPNPISSKKVYTYNPLVLENESFEFKKKYVTPFYIHNANNKMKKEKYAINVNPSMLQDIQVFDKEGSIYDACIIYSMWKGYIKKDKELEEFVNILKNMDMDYYEVYTHGSVNVDILKRIVFKTKPKNIIPLEFEESEKVTVNLPNFRQLEEGETIIL